MTLHLWRRNSVQSEYHYPGMQYEVNLQAICGYYLISEHGLLHILSYYHLHSPDHYSSYPSTFFTLLTITIPTLLPPSVFWHSQVCLHTHRHKCTMSFSFPFFFSIFTNISWWLQFRDWGDVRMRGLKDGEQSESLAFQRATSKLLYTQRRGARTFRVKTRLMLQSHSATETVRVGR